ncbi:hypothetical protein LCGC14_2942610, partial [marine sediment metagenome]
MILKHVPQHTRSVIITCPVPHIYCLSYCDLDMVYMIPVPYGFKDRVPEPEDQNILHGFFSQVMVDPVY